jgi:hypothetical protein
MIKVVTNSLGNCDWVVVKGHCDEVLFEGHRAEPRDIVDILNSLLDCGAELVETTDEQMEEGTY